VYRVAEQVMEKLNIKLTIAGKPYPLSIEREKEERYRRAESDINKIVTEFRGRFRAETYDYLALAAFQIALVNVDMEMSRSLGEEVDELRALDCELQGYLDEV
jgi:hypothetical protein